MKLKTIYVCQNCKFESPKWIGKCPECNGWNSFIEDVINIGKPDKRLSPTPRASNPVDLRSITNLNNSSERFSSGIGEFDRVLGGNGFVPGSITLLSGEPGIGKSTLTLQIAGNISNSKKTILISGEESVEQISGRADRIAINNNLTAINETNLENILEIISDNHPDFVIIDSIQVIYSLDLPGTSGSINQIRYCTEQLMNTAKRNKITILLIGHVTKDGNLAGPRVLEHLVDTVLSLEGDRYQHFRILKSAKNRFGSCNEVGIFDMAKNGLIEVKNPSELFLEGRSDDTIGSSITVTLEGIRPILIEVQALTSTTHFGYPKRTSNGYDLNRLQILIAVLEKYGKLKLQDQDIFINVVGGIKLNDPGADLAVAAAITSSFFKKPIPGSTVIFGEVGLCGELRKITQMEKRIKEADNLGFKNHFTPETFKKITDLIEKIS